MPIIQDFARILGGEDETKNGKGKKRKKKKKREKKRKKTQTQELFRFKGGKLLGHGESKRARKC